jgi:hypothetical protein
MKRWIAVAFVLGSGGSLGCGGAQAAEETRVTATINTPPITRTALDACAGAWTGIGVQEGSSWTIDLAVTPVEGPGPCGSIDYPTLGCGGYVEGCTVRPDGHVWMREVYTRNPGTCAPAGEILAHCENGRMAWTWIGLGGPVSSTLVAQ